MKQREGKQGIHTDHPLKNRGKQDFCMSLGHKPSKNPLLILYLSLLSHRSLCSLRDFAVHASSDYSKSSTNGTCYLRSRQHLSLEASAANTNRLVCICYPKTLRASHQDQQGPSFTVSTICVNLHRALGPNRPLPQLWSPSNISPEACSEHPCRGVLRRLQGASWIPRMTVQTFS